jgi:hypothetical protein
MNPRAILGMVTGGLGTWWVLGAALAAGIAGAYVAHELDAGPLAEARTATESCLKDRATDVATANTIALTGLKQSIDQALAADKATAEAANRRAARSAALAEKLRHVPSTKACASSPAMRALIDSLRQGN